jgi:hypothetical protein
LPRPYPGRECPFAAPTKDAESGGRLQKEGYKNLVKENYGVFQEPVSINFEASFPAGTASSMPEPAVSARLRH